MNIVNKQYGIRIFSGLVCALSCCIVLAAAPQKKEAPMRIETSYSQQAFVPAHGESLSIRYTLSKPSDLVLTIEGPDGRNWYRATQKNVAAGYGEFIWKGVDSKGKPVPAEAYRYKITATHNNETLISDAGDIFGGKKLDVTQVTIDPANNTLNYFLQRPARVRIMAKLNFGSVPLGTLLDWEARPAGMQREVIQLDQYQSLFPGKDIVPYLVQAWSLPDNSIIVLPPTGFPARKQFNEFKTKPSGDIKPWYAWNSANVLQHATHNYDRCYDPAIEIKPVGAVTKKSDVITVGKTTAFRLNAQTDQGVGRVTPIPRLSLFVFVDDAMVTRLLPAYLPFQWQLDPTKFSEGEHVITAMLSWRDEHIGITHQKIVIPAGVGKPIVDKDK